MKAFERVLEQHEKADWEELRQHEVFLRRREDLFRSIQLLEGANKTETDLFDAKLKVLQQDKRKAIQNLADKEKLLNTDEEKRESERDHAAKYERLERIEGELQQKHEQFLEETAEKLLRTRTELETATKVVDWGAAKLKENAWKGQERNVAAAHGRAYFEARMRELRAALMETIDAINQEDERLGQEREREEEMERERQREREKMEFRDHSPPATVGPSSSGSVVPGGYESDDSQQSEAAPKNKLYAVIIDEVERDGLSFSIPVPKSNADLNLNGGQDKDTPAEPNAHAWRSPKAIMENGRVTTELLTIQATLYSKDNDGQSKTTLVCPAGPGLDGGGPSTQIRWL
jgi:hypothetical protein